MNIHESQKKILNYLSGIQDLDGISYWEIARETGLTNAQNVVHHLKQLEKLGYLRRDSFNPSSFEILKNPIEDVVYLNLLGFAQCGNETDFFCDTNVREKIAISTKLFGISNPKNSFLIRAKGDSMSPEIFDNDLIIFESTSDVDDGSVALVIDNDEPKIKQVFKTSNGILLRSFNKQHQDKVVKDSDIRILGLAKHLIKKYLN
jgi:repressor LexA